MFSSNDYTNNNNGAYPLALYLSPLSNHGNNISSSSSYNHPHRHHQHQQHPYNQQNLHPNDPFMASRHDHQFSSPTMPESLINYMAFSSNDVMMEQNLMNGGCSNQVEALKGIKKAVKKDRHSKIHTAQGLRDRRVRLSIGIARQFFDLQDMLGFDKASKTLEWLLTKSRKAIKEVVHAKKLTNGDFRGAANEDECYENIVGNEEEAEQEEEEEDNIEEKSFMSGSSSEYCEDMVFEAKKLEIGGSTQREKRKKNELSNTASNSSRNKVRDKIRSSNIDQPEMVYEITQSQILDSLRSTSVNEGGKKLPLNVHSQDTTRSFYEQPIEELNRLRGPYLDNQESNFIRRKIKPLTPLVTSYVQQNGGVLVKDQGSISNNISILPQNWDIYDQNPFLDQPFGSFSPA